MGPAPTKAPLPLPTFVVRALRPFQSFFRLESSSGLVLLASTFAALFWANSRWSHAYEHLLEQRVVIQLGGFGIDWELHHFINDGLMSVFFFTVGMEIKRELVLGELSSLRKAALPLIAAAGGMAAPALLFTLLNAGTPGSRGWGIPTATDIAFALGCVALMKSRVPPSLPVFLMALAIFDDLGAILVIALFYGGAVKVGMLGLAAALTLLLVTMNLFGVRAAWLYAVVGVVLWGTFLQTGVHATIAGVILGLAMPARPRRRIEEQLDELKQTLEAVERANPDVRGDQALTALEQYLEEAQTPLTRLVTGLHPWVAYGIVPAFALANAGVSLGTLGAKDLASPVSLGVAAGLFFGKQAGIFAATWLAVRFGISPMPAGATWKQVYGIALLGGIGFTMSLFIAALAFPGEGALNAAAKVGILAGSCGSAVAGTLFLRFAGAPAPVAQEAATAS